jgi:acetyltransferase-like isoleucine patch superfamily enzyme
MGLLRDAKLQQVRSAPNDHPHAKCIVIPWLDTADADGSPRRPVRDPLCGRPSIDWLVESIRNAGVEDIVRFTPPGFVSPVHTEGRQGFQSWLQRVTGTRLQLVVPDVTPLLSAETILQALQDAASVTRAVVVRLASPEERRDGGQAAVVCDGSTFAELVETRGMRPTDLVNFDHVLGKLSALGVEARVIEASQTDSLRVTTSAGYSATLAVMYEKVQADLMNKGVIIEDPPTTRIDHGVEIGAGTTIASGCILQGKSRVGTDCTIGPHVLVINATLGNRITAIYSVCKESVIDDDANIGPFAWIRSGSRIGQGCRIGVFVEIARSQIGTLSHIPHLSALLDANVGRFCNIGGLSGTANYNGQQKNTTWIGDNACIGGGNLLIAPVRIEDWAYTAAGSTITRNVPRGALGIARAVQSNIAGWVRRHRASSRESVVDDQ